LLPISSTRSTIQAAPAYEGILYTVFQQLRQGVGHNAAGVQGGLVVAFTSANPGEGVTHTIQALLDGLTHNGNSRSLLVRSEHLRSLTVPPADLPRLCRPLTRDAEPSVYELMDEGSGSGAKPGAGAGTGSWLGSWEYRRDALDQFRAYFDYVLIDCPALKQSNDILSVAPFADGVILIVEAGRTRKEQVLHAEKSIEFARGRLLGHILNKREYVVPEWLYRRI
jgi:hypothetical protein